MCLFIINSLLDLAKLDLYGALKRDYGFFKIVLWINRYKNHKFDLNHN